VPLDTETAIVTGTVDLGAGGVRVQTLVTTNNAAVTNGTMSVENLRLLSGSTLDSTAVSVLAALIVGGTNCTFRNTTLAIIGVGSGILQPVPPATTATLVLTQGSSFQFGGVLSLTDGAQIIGGGLPQSKLVIGPTAVLLSTNSTVIRGATSAHLLIDQSGLTQVDGGTLIFGDGIDWQCSAGSQEFRAVAPSSLILFSNVFHTDASVITLFTGSGTNRWLKGASVDGTAQVSVADPGTHLAGPGNLEILDSVSGAGMVHILGTTSAGGIAVWENGKFSCPALTVDAGASLELSGGTGGFRQLAGCVVTNQGSCSFLGGELDFSQGAVFNNQAGALFSVQGDGNLMSADTSGIFLNAGTFQKLSAGTTYFGDTNSSAGPAFNNTGLCDTQGGQLSLLGGAGSSEFRQASGTVLWFSGGSYVANIGCSFTGNGKVLVAQGAAPAQLVLNDSISFSDLELGTNGVLEAALGAWTNPASIATLLAHDNAEITNGSFQIQSLHMLDQSRIDLSTFEVTGSLNI
jgi:hypothetical protein